MYMYVSTCMYVCIYVCMYVCMYACMYVFIYVCMYLYMHVGMYYVCMYVCRFNLTPFLITGEPISHPLKSLVKRLTDKELSSPETTPTHQSSQEGEDTVL